ncbi:MAG: DoxX family membrane protein [Bdellovibrionales bacterium]|nr:DoxX family membrane protein [Bdellovibrionales bacterium]
MNKKFALSLRVALGLIFTVFGLNGFLNFLPQPANMPEPAIKFAMAMMETGYLMTLVKGVEVISGIMLLTGFFIPLAQLFLSPIIINIFLFHAFLAPQNGGLVMPSIIVVLQIALAYQYKESYKSVLKAK